MSRLRITKLDESQYLTCMKHSLWGSKSARFKDWQEGDYLAVIVDKAFAVLAQVDGRPFISKERIWDKALYPHRIKVKFIHALAPEDRIPILGEVRNALTTAWGPKYGWGILNQQLLGDEQANTIITAIRSKPNSLSKIKSNIEEMLTEARKREEFVPKKQVKRGRRKKEDETEREGDDGEKESEHSKAQNALINLGLVTGCSVWIASNDRKRLFQGRELGEKCLKSMPNLGLSEEATKRISYIDVIWIRDNGPVCAFEVEMTTSIFSGLLRLSDLISVVPALNINLFIVAPLERQNNVMAELGRPTFRKIGLSDYCRFIPAELLDTLFDKVRYFSGHIKHTLIETLAVELEEDESEDLI